MTITHDPTDETRLSDLLGRRLGASQPDVLKRSPLFRSNVEVWSQRVRYSAETPLSRIVCYSTSETNLQVLVEPTQGRLDQAFQSAWGEVRSALATRRPALVSASQVDDQTQQTIREGHAGWRVEARQRDFLEPSLLALATLSWSRLSSHGSWRASSSSGAACQGGSCGLDAVTFESQVETKLTDQLSSNALEFRVVRHAPSLGAGQPDFIVQSGGGKTEFAVDVKFASDPKKHLPFASVAHAASAVKHVAAETGADYSRILITNAEVDQSTMAVAREVGVKVFQVRTDEFDADVGRVVRRIVGGGSDIH